MSDSIEDRMARRQAEEDDLRRKLMEVQLDGPFKIRPGDFVSALFGGDFTYAVCQRCGAMVRLADPMETTEGRQIERGVKLHVDWHQAVDRG